MPKLPAVSGREVIKILENIGYASTRQKGSHVRLIYKDNTKKPITVPLHPELGKGLLRKILRDTNLSVEEFYELL